VVSLSALELRWVRDVMGRALGPRGPHEGERALPLTEKDITSLRRGWENATKAYNALAPLAETERESGLLHEELAPVGGGEER
jgi:hypothetical protein